jgi:hypothetical protein
MIDPYPLPLPTRQPPGRIAVEAVPIESKFRVAQVLASVMGCWPWSDVERRTGRKRMKDEG